MIQHTHLATLERILLWVVLSGIPLVYVPSLFNSTELPKQVFLTVSAFLLLILAWIRLLATKTVTVLFSLPLLGLFALTMVSCVSLLIHTGHPFASLLHPFGGISLLSISIIAAAIVARSHDASGREDLLFGMLFASIVAGIVSLVWAIGQIFPTAQVFPVHPTGGLKTALAVQWLPLFLAVPILLKKRQSSLPLGLTTATTLAGILAILTTILFVSRFQSIAMPFTLGWQVATEAIKNKPLDGVGPLNYEHLFTQSRPAALNVSDLWNVRFLNAPNLVFHLLSIYGITGLLVCGAWLLFAVLRTAKSSHGAQLSALGIFAAAFLFPADLVTLLFLVTALILAVPLSFQKQIPLRTSEILLSTTLAVPLLFLLTSLYLFGPALQTEHLLNRINTAIRTETTAAVPELLAQARSHTPYRDDLAVLASQLSLQQTILLLRDANETSDQEPLVAAINQTINLGQEAVGLNPVNSTNWKNLADIYIQLSPYVDNASDWSIRTLEQSFLRDPSNAFIRAEIADLFFRQGNMFRAIQILESAVSLKPDFPPFLYALARLYVQIQDYSAAEQALLQTRALLPETSPDAATIDADLAALRQARNQPAATQSAVPKTEDTPPTPTIQVQASSSAVPLLRP